MTSLKQLRNRIKSIKSTQKLTKAMQMVAASKLKKVKDDLGQSDDYLKIIKQILFDLSTTDIVKNLNPAEQKFFKNNEVKTHLLIIMTSERGLCGSFNSAIVKKAKNDLAKFIRQGEKFRIIVIGKKGYDLLRNNFGSYIENYFPQAKKEQSELVKIINQKISELVEKDQVNSVSIYYNKFKNAITQIVTSEQILPLIQPEDIASNKVNYEYEGEGLLTNLLNLYFQGELNYAMLQNVASEEGARMTAMDNATKNAGEIVSDLTLKMNRSRQAIITKELTEIIAGAESV